MDAIKLKHGKKPVADVWTAPKEAARPPSIDSMPESKALKKVEAVAVLPFVSVARKANNTLNANDLIEMGESFANHLVGSQSFKTLLYPQQVLDATTETDLNMLKMEDLKELGNMLDVDALVYGIIKKYDMYYPPKLSVSMKFYLTRLGRFATANEISNLAHSGVPLLTYNPTFFKQLWDHSGFYDSSNSHFAKILKHYEKTHDSTWSGFYSDRYRHTKKDFLNFITYDLANSLNCSKSKREENYTPPSNPKGGKKKPRVVRSGYFHR